MILHHRFSSNGCISLEISGNYHEREMKKNTGNTMCSTKEKSMREEQSIYSNLEMPCQFDSKYMTGSVLL